MKGRKQSGGSWYVPRPAAWTGLGLSTQVRGRLDQFEFFLAGATVFLAPINTLRYPGFYLTLSDVLAATCLFVMLLNRSLPVRPFGSVTFWWILGLIMLIGGLLVSSLVNGDAIRGLIISAQYGAAYFVLPLVIVSRPRWQVEILAKLFVLVIVLCCLHGVYLIHYLGETNTNFVSGNGRLMSFMERQNAFAAVIAMTFPLLFWLSEEGRIRRATLWVALPILAYGIMLTGSATGVVGMSYALGIYLLVTVSRSLRQIALAFAGVTAAVAAFAIWGKAILPAVFQKRVLGAIESGDIDKAGTFSHRYELMMEALHMVDDTILLGFGADQYRFVSQLGQPVHNAYLLIWAEGGLFAVIGVLLLIVSGLLMLPGTIHRPGGRYAAICTFCLVTQFAFLINATPHIYARFWTVPLLLGIAVSVSSTQGRASPGRSGGVAGN